MNKTTFSGSYQPDEVTFLLKEIDLEPTSLPERERRIQAGLAHYSEMIGRESAPSAEYLEVFHEAMAHNGSIMARHVAALASIIAAGRKGCLTLVSLARAGVPIGVLLTHTLRRYFKREVKHYSVSIIRDRGIDENALTHILKEQGRPDSSIVFVDGWTGKGVITRELIRTVAGYNQTHGTSIPPDLHVLTDLCGLAGSAPSSEDFLVPSSILNSIVSGLISRTILNRDYIGPDDFHGCVYYRELAGHDLSRWFVDQIMDEIERLNEVSPVTAAPAAPLDQKRRERLWADNENFLKRIRQSHGLRDSNFIKPGIGEATRVMLRRVPDVLILKNPDEADVRHLRVLAAERKVPVIADPALPYRAAALIKTVSYV